MKRSNVLAVMALSAALLSAGCAGPGYQQSSSNPAASQTASSYGVVESIDMANAQGGGVGVGAIAGGVVGGLLGNQVGSGRGRTAATVAGAVGGAVAGNQIEQRRNQQPAYNVRVHLDDGSYRTVTQDSVADLRVGNRVRIENGRVYRY